MERENRFKALCRCLMPNHVHLVVEPGWDVKTVSLLMKRLAGRQSVLVNKLERRAGALWDGRFDFAC